MEIDPTEKLKQLRSLHMAAPRKQALRQQLVRHIQMHPYKAPKAWLQRWQELFASNLIAPAMGLAMVILILGGLGVNHAAANSAPGDFWYPAKIYCSIPSSPTINSNWPRSGLFLYSEIIAILVRVASFLRHKL